MDALALEKTFVMVKPDGVRRGLVGEVIRRLEAKGLSLKGLKLMRVPPPLAEAHYQAHREKPFFGELISFITSGPVVAMVWEGPRAVEAVRRLMGATDPLEAAPGSIRGDFALEIGANIVHGSDSPQAAAREIELFFREEELL